MTLANILQKKLLILAALVLSIFLVLVSDDLQQLVGRRIPTATPTPRQASPSATPGSVHGGELVTVVDVIDGDTVKIEGGEIVRYIGMNTPETVDPRKPLECYGKEASAKNKELVQGKVVELEKDVSERDTYGRLLRNIWIGEALINETLVREGFAYVSTYPPDVKYEAGLLEAQRLARDEGKGLWAGCPLPTSPKRMQPTGQSTPSETPASDVIF